MWSGVERGEGEMKGVIARRSEPVCVGVGFKREGSESEGLGRGKGRGKDGGKGYVLSFLISKSI